MSIPYSLEKKCKLRIILLLCLLCNSACIFSQIQVFERPTDSQLINTGLFFESPTRKKIDLNGQWDISFNLGKSFQKFIVPLAYNFEGSAIFKRKFDISEDDLNMYSYIFVAEGIDYDSEVKINNNFVANHSGGYTPVIVPLPDGIMTQANEIVINVKNELNFKNTIPLSDQINYSKVYGGINKDIYIIAVPKLFVFENTIRYKVDNLLSVKVTNLIDIKSSNLKSLIDTSKSGEFFVQTRLVRKSDENASVESERIPFTIGENNSVKVVNELTISNPVLWTPESPELYTVEVIISNGETVIDNYVLETGFTNLDKRSNQIFISGRQIKINGVNYYEDQPKYSSALDYREVEKDLRNIKTLGFNSVRVPGRCAHPYIVNLCNRIGLFLLQEIPFNELSDAYVGNEKYRRQSQNYLADIIDRDKNAPCIFAWGIGNDFDVSNNASLEYVRSSVAIIDSLNKRFKYYTSRPYNVDICSEEVDFVGINFYSRSYENIKSVIADVTTRTPQNSNRKNNSLFVSAYGLNIDNGNTDGFSNPVSQEAQMKFLFECNSKISQHLFGNFISSYADWNSENPLNYPLDANDYLKTNGLYTFNREQKRSAEYVKRILNKEDLPRVQEGNFVPDFPYVFIIIGIAFIVILVYFINKDKKFRSGLMRCLYKPTYFFSLVKDQMIISTGYNLFLTLSISIGLALFFASILYFYKESNSFDMILAKIFSNDSAKKIFSDTVNNKFYLLSSLTVINLLLTFLTAIFLYFVSFYTKGKSFFKNIYTICIWSTLPMLLFLFLGTIIYKLAENNPAYIEYSLWAFLILYVLHLNRLIIGAKTLFDIRTGKVYLYGLLIIFIIFALIYSYFLFFTGAIETIDLVTYLKG